MPSRSYHGTAVSASQTHTELPDVSADQHHAQSHTDSQHSDGPNLKTAATNVADLTDSTGGTPGATLIDVTTSTLADPDKINDDLASLNAQVKAITDALIAAGLMAAS